MDATPYSLRSATLGDYDFLYDLHVSAMREYVAQTWGWDDAVQQELFRSRFTPEGRQVIVVDGEDAGELLLDQRPGELFLERILLLPHFQGRGLGTAVVRQVLAHAGAAGLPVTLTVLRVNPARGLYERLGFRVVEETELRFHMRWDPPSPQTA